MEASVGEKIGAYINPLSEISAWESIDNYQASPVEKAALKIIASITALFGCILFTPLIFRGVVRLWIGGPLIGTPGHANEVPVERNKDEAVDQSKWDAKITQAMSVFNKCIKYSQKRMEVAVKHEEIEYLIEFKKENGRDRNGCTYVSMHKIVIHKIKDDVVKEGITTSLNMIDNSIGYTYMSEKIPGKLLDVTNDLKKVDVDHYMPIFDLAIEELNKMSKDHREAV